MKPTTASSLRVVSDVVPSGWLSGPARSWGRGAFPASLSQTWGEASWTAPDVWMTVPVLAALRASAALSDLKLPTDVAVQQTRTYRRVRQTADELRTRAADEWRTRAADEWRARTELRGREKQAQTDEPPTATDAMLALGGRVAAWTERLVLLVFLLIVIGLGIELGVAGAIPFP